MDSSLIIFFSIIIILGAALLAIIGLNKGNKHLNVEYYRTEWLKIENHLIREQKASYQMSVINADKLVDRALKDSGLKGNTMGDRMKLMNKNFSNRNAVWDAHKLRNKIAHESGTIVGYDDARHALGGFKQALKDLGAI